MNETITIGEMLAIYAIGQAITVSFAYWWAMRSFLRGYRQAERECQKRRVHEIANQMRASNPRPWFHHRTRSATSRFHRE